MVELCLKTSFPNFHPLKKLLLSPSCLKGPWWITRSTPAWLCGSFCLCFAIHCWQCCGLPPAILLPSWPGGILSLSLSGPIGFADGEIRPGAVADCCNFKLDTNLRVGMPCIYDQEISALEREALTHAILAAKHILGFQDCIYGMRRCLSGACMPFQPCLVTVTVSCFPSFKMCAANLRGRLHDLQMADRIDGSNMDEH